MVCVRSFLSFFTLPLISMLKLCMTLSLGRSGMPFGPLCGQSGPNSSKLTTKVFLQRMIKVLLPKIGLVQSPSGLPEPQFWAVLPPLLLFVIIYKMLHDVVSKTEPLLEKDKQDDLLAKACGGLYLFKNGRVLVLTFELICIFAANNAFVTAAAIELQRNGFSSAWIGMITMPSGLMQCLLSQWAGRVAGSVKNRERILLYTPTLLGSSLLFIAFIAKSMAFLATLDSSVSTLLVPILSTLVVSSAALGAADAPAMSMMADLAAAQGVGYGQALTASEMAINAGRFQPPETSGILRKPVNPTNGNQVIGYLMYL